MMAAIRCQSVKDKRTYDTPEESSGPNSARERTVRWGISDDVTKGETNEYSRYDQRSKSLYMLSQSDTWNARRHLARQSLSSPLLLYRSRARSIVPKNRARRLSSIKLENDHLLRRFRTQIPTSPFEEIEFNDVFADFTNSSDSSIRLEEHIKLHHLQKLLQVFKSHNPSNFDHKKSAFKQNIDRPDDVIKRKQEAGMMTLDEFKTTISGMLGTARWNDQMEMLFYKVDTTCDGYVDWNEFCTYMLLQMREVEHIQNLKALPFSSAAVVRQIFHNKQETTTRALVVESPTRVVTVSKVGAIGVWDFELRLLKTYSLAADVSEDHQQSRRRFHTWVTDVAYMRNTQNLALTTSSREIYFYDVSTSIYNVEFCLFAIPNVPVCAHYWYNKSARNSHSMLLFGDDTGSVHILHFSSPQSRLFQKPYSPQQGTQRVYFNDLRDHRQFVRYECVGNIHDDVIRRLRYIPEGDVIISSSMSSVTSLVLMDKARKNKPYVFKVNKGVECFDFSKHLNILVTGSLDHLVRIWNPYVTARPITILQGHSTGICDVIINEGYAQIVTYSKDVVIKVWDIKEHNCLQTVSPKFPSLQPGRIPDHGEFPLSLYGSPHDVMLVTCNDSMALLKMGKLEPKSELPTTHDAPLCGAAFNPLFHQVVTASDDSCVSVWDVETGSRSLKFSNAHGQEEITCLNFDDTCRRLLTGARDGTIKVWNFQNGNCLHELESVDDSEVTGIISFHDRTILAAGWSRLMVLYDDTDPDTVNVKIKSIWKGGKLHKDDILTVCHCPPNLLATGSYDGCVVIWNEEKQQIYLTLREGKLAKEKQSSPSRPIDKLKCLAERSKHAKRNRATLVSSESGQLFWWCLFGRANLLGHFRATQSTDASILTMCTSSDDNYLITADTAGFVCVWDIEHFCITDQNDIVTSPPPLSYQWKAHDGAIVSVDFIDNELQAMVVTSSTDKTARMWTLEGRLVGTFGQKKKWNLKKRTSYQYPLDPWGGIVECAEPGDAYKKKHPEIYTTPECAQTEDIAENNENGDSTLSEEQLNNNEHNESEDSSLSEPSERDAESDQSEGAESDVGSLPDIDAGKSPNLGRRMTHHHHGNGSHAPLLPHLRYRESRAMTFADFSAPRKERILGDRAEAMLTRRTATRQERRFRVGYIDRNTTARFSGLCSPYQALSIKDTESVSFANQMPMSKRMMEKGMQCQNEIELRKMALNGLADFTDHEVVKTSHKKRTPHVGRRSTLLPAIVTSPSASSVAVATEN